MGLTTWQCCFSLCIFFFSFIGLPVLILFLVAVGCLREERRKARRCRMIPVIASGTLGTVWQLLLIKQVLLFKVWEIWAGNMQLGKQTEISSADKHVLKTGERRKWNRIPHECKHAEWLGCVRMCVSTRAHSDRPARARAADPWESVKCTPQKAVWLGDRGTVDLEA